MKKILLLNAHPRENSLCNALAHAYAKGAKKAGHDVKFAVLRDLEFDPILRNSYRDNVLEPDLQKQQENISWCDHMVIVTPMWWFSTPALLKGFLDRVITPRFAFRYKKGSLLPFPERLLKGRSARVIYTQGGPWWIPWIFGLNPFWQALRFGTLIFCGFGPVRRTTFSKVVGSSDEKRAKWLKKVYQVGKKGR